MATLLRDYVIYNDPNGTSNQLLRCKGIDGFNNPIPNVGDPVANKDASNKEWTEGAIATAINAIDIPSYGWERILVRNSIVDQQPVALDTPLQVNFGAAFSPPNNELSIDATGNITINQAGFYRVCVALNIGRSAGAGIADLYIRSLKNATQQYFIDGNRLDDNNNFRTLCLLPIDDNFLVGDVIAYEMKRGAGQVNDGGLFAIPDVGNPSWGTLPSSTVIIYRFVETIT